MTTKKSDSKKTKAPIVDYVTMSNPYSGKKACVHKDMVEVYKKEGFKAV